MKKNKLKDALKFEVSNYKTNGVAAAEVVAGIAGANAMTKLIPVSNPWIKSAIPFAVGAAMLGFSNSHLSSIGSGMAAFGALSLVNHAVRGAVPGADGDVTEGIGNIGSNPMVNKIADILVPNLGSTENYSAAAYYPAIEDVDYEDMPLNGYGGEFDLLAGADGIEDDFESLAGGDTEYWGGDFPAQVA